MIDFDKLDFSLTPTANMFVATKPRGSGEVHTLPCTLLKEYGIARVAPLQLSAREALDGWASAVFNRLL